MSKTRNKRLISFSKAKAMDYGFDNIFTGGPTPTPSAVALPNSGRSGMAEDDNLDENDVMDEMVDMDNMDDDMEDDEMDM